MRKLLTPALMVCSLVMVQAQEYSFIRGSENIIETVRTGLNSVPNMKASGVASNLTHILSINPTGASFGLMGSFSVGSLHVTMPDGKTFNYQFNKQENAFICSELTGSMARIGANAVGLIFTSATALGKEIPIDNSDQNISFSFENKIYYGKILSEKLNQYGSGKDKDGKPAFLGSSVDLNNILKIQPHVSVNVSGLSQNSYNGYSDAVELVRSAYSSWLQSQQSAAPTSTGTSSSSSSVTALSTSASSNSSSNTTSNEMYKKAEEAGNSIQQSEYERQAAERQRQERLQQATNPGGYYLQRTGVNDYFNAEINRINRAAEAKERQEEREWLNRQRRERAEQARREKELEEWRKDQLAKFAANQEQRLNEYNAKGGLANYNAKQSQWAAFAKKEMEQVSQYLGKYEGEPLSFTLMQNNCDYVEAIEKVQNSEMPTDYKLILIKNLLNVRFQAAEVFRENGYHPENWKSYKDNLYWDINKAPCGNFLDEIAYSLGTDIHIEGTYGTSGDIFGTNSQLFINNAYDERVMAEGNYALPVGTAPKEGSYTSELFSAGILMLRPQIMPFTNSENDEIWNSFHTNPFDWSNGYVFHREAGRYSSGWNYKSKVLAGNQSAIQAEIEKYIAAYDLKRSFSLNTAFDEQKMMLFNYNRGAIAEAYEHLQRYMIMEFGDYQGLADVISKATESSYEPIETGIMISGVLIEAGDYGNARIVALATYNKAYELWKNQFDKKPFNTLLNRRTFTPMYVGARTLLNRLHFMLGEYDKLYMFRTKETIERSMDRVDENFKFVRVTSSRVWAPTPDQLEAYKFQFVNATDPHLNAYALMKLGHDDLAEMVMEQSIKYYSKKDAPAFIGTSLDLDIYQQLAQKFFSNKADKISYRTGLIDLNKRTIPTQSNNGDDFAYLTKLASNSNISPLIQLDLTNHPKWAELFSRLDNTQADKESLSEIFSGLKALGKGSILTGNEASKNYLLEYIQLGLCLGQFHEVLPALTTYKSLFPDDDSIKLEEELTKVMWPQKENLISKIVETKYNAEYTQRILVYHPTRTYFEEEVRNNEALKSRLNLYTFAWSKFRVSGVQIPYLYSLN